MQVSAAIEARSLLDTWRQLGVIDRVPASERARLERLVQAAPAEVVTEQEALREQAIGSAG
jgi:hypothetical protein